MHLCAMFTFVMKQIIHLIFFSDTQQNTKDAKHSPINMTHSTVLRKKKE